MTENEMKQIERDTLCDIYELEKKVACLKRKLENTMKPIETIIQLWGSGDLGTNPTGESFAKVNGFRSDVIGPLPKNSELLELLKEKMDTEKELKSLHERFSEMTGKLIQIKPEKSENNS